MVRQFLPETARLAARFSQLAYDPSFPIEEECGFPATPHRFGTLRVIRDGSDVCYVFKDLVTSTFWVVFRGTDDLKDVVGDLMCGLSSDDYGFDGAVHAGFVAAAKGFMTPVSEALDWLGYSKDSWVCYAGHSRGGALAGLVASYLSDPTNVFCKHVFTFGAPRYGDARLMESLVHQLYAFENAGDPIPKIPPTTLGYASPRVTVLSKTNHKCAVGFPPLGKSCPARKVIHDLRSICKLAMYGCLPGLFLRTLKKRHSAASYYSRVQEALVRQNKK